MSSEAERPALQVEIDLVTGSEPIHGSVRVADGNEHSFHGWLDLMQVLDTACISNRSAASGSSSDT